MAPDVEITTQNGWNQWSRYVLKELERLHESTLRIEKSNIETVEKINKNVDDKIKNVDEKIDNVTKDIIALKIKAAGWGFLAGSLPLIIGIVLWLFENVTLK